MCTEASVPDLSRRREGGPGPLVLGLVGPAGSGKSTVARTLAAEGARVLDADRIGHEVTDGDPDVRHALVAEYGADVYGPDGRLDRARVAARVFRDPAALARLNALVQPRILARLRAGIADAVRTGFAGAVVVDAALLLDWGFEKECDAVIAVVAPRELQVARLRAARGWSVSEAARRLANARTNEAFERAANDTIVNDGTPTAAEAAARAVLAKWLKMKREQRS